MTESQGTTEEIAETTDANSLSRDFASEMFLKADGKALVVSLIESCRRIFANCPELNPEKVQEIRRIMEHVRCSDVGLPEKMRLTQIEYIHVMEVDI